MKTQTYKAVLLPTHKNTGFYLNRNGKLKLSNENPPHGTNSIDQILYIIGDEEIKKDDWCYDTETNSIRQWLSGTIKAFTELIKIIASTDKSLNLPWIDLSKSQWIIDFYNKNKELPEIELETKLKEWSWGKLELKLNPDGSVNIIEPVKIGKNEPLGTENVFIGHKPMKMRKCCNKTIGDCECWRNAIEKSDEELKESKVDIGSWDDVLLGMKNGHTLQGFTVGSILKYLKENYNPPTKRQ